MEVSLGTFGGGRLYFEAVVMARGQYTIEVIEPGDLVALVLVHGRVCVSRQRAGQPTGYRLHGGPREPVFLVNPGTYTIVAERSVLGLRGVRRPT